MFAPAGQEEAQSVTADELSAGDSLALIGTTVRFGMQQQEREERRKHKQDLVNQLDTIATLQSVNSNKDPIH